MTNAQHFLLNLPAPETRDRNGSPRRADGDPALRRIGGTAALIEGAYKDVAALQTAGFDAIMFGNRKWGVWFRAPSMSTRRTEVLHRLRIGAIGVRFDCGRNLAREETE